MTEKRNIRLTLEYDGTAYHGWQRQSNALTVQQILEEKISIISNEQVCVLGSGRTDAGVHALNQVCNFYTGSKIDPESMIRGLNSLLPDDIFIRKLEVVSPDFHSRYSAKSKVYEYRILNRPEPDLFLRRFVWHVRGELRVEEMRMCLDMLKGEHDFSSFKSAGSSNMDPVRKMIRAELTRSDDCHLSFIFEADGFLRHMVRNIVGTVVEAGRGFITADKFREIFSSGDRCRAGVKAPPQGLFLKDVRYR